MKKRAWFSLLMVCILLTACNIHSDKNKDDSDKTRDQQGQKVAKNVQQENSKQKDNNKDYEVSNQKSNKEEKIEPKYKVADNWSIVPIDEANEKVVLLTFDDAPDEHALDMAKTLKKLDANAIFFVNGHFLETPEKKEILKQIHDMGFLIGNHTYSHAYLPDLSKKEQKKEIVRVNDMVKAIIGERPKFFRAPNGANTDYTKKVAKKEDMILMNWSYGYDWNEEYMSKEAITDIMLHTELLTSSANLLMHDREWTAAALKDIVKGLRDKGYEMVDPRLIKTR
ncbi:polysaccharide deacetylase family protein [Lentibacillus sp. Marseille-P4043]|uniref:polysaccharide deacetylase family protein n=1 Tax=Lentibacillus sp. Marseille-P4043 TaxID=2040293 RepID=UPI000D0AD820|nr:polysaccharide deacetylase family protein [Lentibacillus sp. Marseille-P4043]